MNMRDLNYGIIVFDDIRIEGEVTDWEFLNNGTANVEIDGIKYKTGVNNILLMHKDKNES